MSVVLISSKQSSGGTNAVIIIPGLGRNVGNRVVLTGGVVEKGDSILPACRQIKPCSLFSTINGDVDSVGRPEKGQQQLKNVEV